MKKLNLVINISTAIVTTSCLSTSANATLVSESTLNFNTGVVDTNSGFVTSGSYFAFDTNGDTTFTEDERIVLEQHNGLIIGSTQLASGSHSGLPGTSAGESPGIDAPWEFFFSTGMHSTSSAVTILNTTASTADLNFSGWGMHWNGGPIALGSGPSNGIVPVICAVNCTAGDTYTLDYFATVPATDPSIGGFSYSLHLEGIISAPSSVPIPAAVWLFSSGLLGLINIARRKIK